MSSVLYRQCKKLHFNKLMNYISGCLFNVFFIFCKGEMKQHIKNYTKEDFDIKFHELYFKQYQIAHTTKTNTEILSIIEKNVNKCIHSLKYYSSINLRYAIVKPFGDALNQLIKEIDKLNNFSFFIQIVLETIFIL